MVWDGIQRVITLKKIIGAFNNLEANYNWHCDAIQKDIDWLLNSDLKVNNFLREYEQVVFKLNGFSMYVLELLNTTKCYFDGYKNEYDQYVTLDVENFKNQRRHFKKKYNKQIREMFGVCQ